MGTLYYASLDEAYGPRLVGKKKKKETFVDAPTPRASTPVIPTLPPNSATNWAAPPRMDEITAAMNTSPAYSAQQSDLNYACKNYRICPPGYTVEGFDGGSSMAAPASGQDDCPPMVLPMLGQDLSDQVKKDINKTVYALDITQADLQGLDIRKVGDRMSSKQLPNKLYGENDIDDELSAYLADADYPLLRASTSVPAPGSLTSTPTPTPITGPSSSQAKGSSPQGSTRTYYPVPGSSDDTKSPNCINLSCPKCPTPLPPKKQIDPMVRWMELGMFALAGILIIFLLEQILRMGILIGMKQTTKFMEPFMEYAQSVAPMGNRLSTNLD